MSGDAKDVLKLAKPSGSDPWGNSALPEDLIAKTRLMKELNGRIKELEKNVKDITRINEAGDRERQKSAAKKAPAKKTPATKAAQKSHIGHVRNHRAVAIEPDLCLVGKCVVAFNSYSILPEETAGSHNVKAIGTRVLREGDLIKGVQADAGKNIATGTSLCDGYLAILEGHRNVKSNGVRVATHNSLCRINTNESGMVGPLARMVTVVKPVEASQAAPVDEPPPGKRTSAKLEALKKLQAQNKEGMLDFDTSDEIFRFKDLSSSAHDLIGVIKGEPGTLLDHGAQAVRGGLGFAADMGIGIGEMAYEGIKLVPKTLQSKLTPSGITAGLLDNAILLENLRLGNITAGTMGQSALDIGAALVKPVTVPWSKGQTTEAIFRGGAEIGTSLLGWMKASKAKKALEAKKAADAADDLAQAARTGRGEVIDEIKTNGGASQIPDNGIYIQRKNVKLDSAGISRVNDERTGTRFRDVEVSQPEFENVDDWYDWKQRYAEPEKFVGDFTSELKGVKPSTNPIYDADLQSYGSALTAPQVPVGNEVLRIGEKALVRDSELFKSIFHEEMHIRLGRQAQIGNLRALDLTTGPLIYEEVYVEAVATRYARLYQQKFGPFKH